MEDILQLRLLFLGDSGVGKSSLILKYVDDYFPDSHMSTIGVDYKEKYITINKRKILLRILDTAGQEQYKSISKGLMKDVDGIIFVYDITRKETFDNIKDWRILPKNNNSNEYKEIIVGNKIDLSTRRQVDEKIVKQFCDKKKLFYLEASAKIGKNVDEIFEKLTNLIVSDMSDNDIKNKINDRRKTIKVSSFSGKTKKEKKKCC